MPKRSSILPPLHLLRTFEVVALRLSFTKAADELFITQSAVSHQIRQLEKCLDCRLFRRLNPGIELTDTGHDLLSGVTEGLERIRQAVQLTRSPRQLGVLTVSAPSSFAAWWLVPRLGRFAKRHPSIEVRIAAVDDVPDFNRDGVDLAIVSVAAEHARLSKTSMPLLREEIFPVCSPALFTDYNLSALKNLSDIHLLKEDQHTHSESSMTPPELEWETWLAHLKIERAGLNGPLFSHFGLALRAAIEGAGLLLGRSPMVDVELAAGRLVRPFGDAKMLASNAYMAAWPEHNMNDARLISMLEFLLDEACGCELAAGPCGMPPTGRKDPIGRSG